MNHTLILSYLFYINLTLSFFRESTNDIRDESRISELLSWGTQNCYPEVRKVLKGEIPWMQPHLTILQYYFQKLTEQEAQTSLLISFQGKEMPFSLKIIVTIINKFPVMQFPMDEEKVV